MNEPYTDPGDRRERATVPRRLAGVILAGLASAFVLLGAVLVIFGVWIGYVAVSGRSDSSVWSLISVAGALLLGGVAAEAAAVALLSRLRGTGHRPEKRS